MIKGFKEFIMRGNVVDLAVAVVIGGAFAAVVETVVTSVIEPVLNRVGGADAATGLGIQLGAPRNTETFINLGAVINALIVFLLTAAVVYFVFVVPMNTFNERRLRGREEPAEEISEDVALLREIRDLLGRQAPGTAGGGATGGGLGGDSPYQP